MRWINKLQNKRTPGKNQKEASKSPGEGLHGVSHRSLKKKMTMNRASSLLDLLHAVRQVPAAALGTAPQAKTRR